MILVDLVLLSLTIQGVGSVLPDGPCAQTLVDTASGRCIVASSVPALGSLYPLSEDLFIDPATGYVGMGDVPLFARLSIRESFYGGISSTTSGGTSSDTIGVLGVATNSSGSDIGVYGHTSSTTLGEGVWGVHAASTGTGPGVRGMTNSIAGGANGVLGEVTLTAPGGFSAGVRGINRGTGGNGIGVYGSQVGAGWGVYGTAGGAGIGVRGASGPGGFGVFSFGDFGVVGAKYFIQPHPEDATKEIRYVCLEGDESGTYFRGSGRFVQGRATVDVPKSFRLVTEADGLTVQLTSRGRAQVWVESVDLDRIVVASDADVAFDYFVNGVRRGFAGHEPVQPNRMFVPQRRDEPYGAALPPAVRQMLVDNGILNPDFTPNEVTAARMGWPLADAPPPDDRRAPIAAER
jgi:hypothetical protein